MSRSQQQAQKLSLSQRFQALLEIPSVSCTDERIDQGNRGVIDLLATWFADLGFKVQIDPIAGQPHKANLIATYGTGAGGLVLAGHTDTVPFDEALWSSDPLSVDERDGRYYGLGICDMKGFFALIIEALKDIDLKQLKEPLIILATADEESSMSGARQLSEAAQGFGPGFKPRRALIGEPTGMQPIYMHKGIMMEKIHILGRSGHSSDPALGNNALEGMNLVISDLLDFRRQMQREHNNPVFTIPTPTLNLGCIHGGDNPNRICGQCSLEFDLRPLPGMQTAELRGMIDQRLQRIAAEQNLEINLEPLFQSIEPFANSADSELVKTCQRLTGLEPRSVAFATEAPFLQEMGLDTLVLGPGDIDQAHQPDEYLGRERIKPMLALLQGLIAEYCMS